MAGPRIKIDGIVALEQGTVMLEPGAADAGRDRVWRALQIAWQRINDEDLVDAWHGGNGRGLSKHSEMTLEEYLALTRIQQAEPSGEERRVSPDTDRLEYLAGVTKELAEYYDVLDGSPADWGPAERAARKSFVLQLLLQTAEWTGWLRGKA